MKLSTRLVLNGVIVPTGILLTGLGVGAWLFDRGLIEALDKALLVQATAESVNLFDDPDGMPHSHTDWSPLTSDARNLVITGGLYDGNGKLLVPHPATATVAQHIAPEPPDLPARLRTVQAAGQSERELAVGITSPRGLHYTLRMVTSLEPHEAALAVLYKSGGLAALLITLLLFGLQSAHARTLIRRIQGLAVHMERLRASDFHAMPPPDPHGDVLSGLRDAIAETTVRLGAARETSERFLADAAHELRTPVAAMSTDIDVILRRERSADELREALVRARRVAGRLTRLAQDLLDMTAQRQTSWECLDADVAQVVAETLAIHRAAAEERGVNLQQTGAPRLAARFHPEGLRQVLTNLVTNALRYAPRGTAIRVDVADLQEKWQLAVEDDGPGVPEAEREAVFEPFHRLERRPEGAGLGLAIVRDVALRHGGRAFVEAAPSGGARFVVELPRQPRIAA